MRNSITRKQKGKGKSLKRKGKSLRRTNRTNKYSGQRPGGPPGLRLGPPAPPAPHQEPPHPQAQVPKVARAISTGLALSCGAFSCKNPLRPNGCRNGQTCQSVTNTATGAQSCGCVSR